MTTPTPEQANPTEITMYGAEWCSDCRRSKKFLDASGVDYVYVDLEADVAAADVARAISGRMQIPVVVFPDGEFFVEPTDAELATKLEAAAA